jgi:hypothetical protein
MIGLLEKVTVGNEIIAATQYKADMKTALGTDKSSFNY